MKPPMPDPLHLEEFGELSRKVGAMELENRQLKLALSWALGRTICNALTEAERAEYTAAFMRARELATRP